MQWQGSAMVGGSNCICIRENRTAWGWHRQWVLISLVELIYNKFGSEARKSRLGFSRTVFRHTWGKPKPALMKPMGFYFFWCQLNSNEFDAVTRKRHGGRVELYLHTWESHSMGLTQTMRQNRLEFKSCQHVTQRNFSDACKPGIRLAQWCLLRYVRSCGIPRS